MKYNPTECREWYTTVISIPSAMPVIDFHYGIPGIYTFFSCIAIDLDDAHERLRIWKERKLREPKDA